MNIAVCVCVHLQHDLAKQKSNTDSDKKADQAFAANDVENHPLKDENASSAGSSDDEEGNSTDKSVLQAKLTTLAVQIGYGGFIVSLVTVIVLIAIFLINSELQTWII